MRSILPLFALAGRFRPGLASEVVPVSPFQSVELRGGGEVTCAWAGTARDDRQRQQPVHARPGATGWQAQIDACNARCPQHYRPSHPDREPESRSWRSHGGGMIDAARGFAPQREFDPAVNGGGKIDARSSTRRRRRGRQWRRRDLVRARPSSRPRSTGAERSTIRVTRRSRPRRWRRRRSPRRLSRQFHHFHAVALNFSPTVSSARNAL